MVNDFPQFPSSWRRFLEHPLSSPAFQDLLKTVAPLYQTETIYPPVSQVFRAFELCPPHQLKVVVLGQDPYHGMGQAHGLCFSVNEGVRIPPSLRNIYKEIQNDVEGYTPPSNGDLSHWASQGILLLNAVLTVKAAEPGSHSKLGWMSFTDAVIQTISEKKENVVFLLWGAFAIGKRPLIDENKHLVLTAPHPSPLARVVFLDAGILVRRIPGCAAKDWRKFTGNLPMWGRNILRPHIGYEN